MKYFLTNMNCQCSTTSPNCGSGQMRVFLGKALLNPAPVNCCFDITKITVGNLMKQNTNNHKCWRFQMIPN